MFLFELDSDFRSLAKDEQTSHAQTCSKCQKGKIKQRAEMRFVHFYQFPIFPLMPCKQTYCDRCHKVLKRESLTQQVFSLPFIAAKFIGLVLLLLLAVNAWSNYQTEKVLEISYLQQPQRHDVWIVNETIQQGELGQQDRFKIMQIASVSDGKVQAKVGQVIYPSVSNAIKAIRLDNLMINSYFSSNLDEFQQQQLINLKQQGIIESAYRPKNLSLFGGFVMTEERPKPFKVRHRPNPLNQEAIRLYQQKEYELAAKLFEEAAQQGSAWAQYNLGDMYLRGIGVKQDETIAISYLQQAADQGLASAQRLLAQNASSKQ